MPLNTKESLKFIVLTRIIIKLTLLIEIFGQQNHITTIFFIKNTQIVKIINYSKTQ